MRSMTRIRAFFAVIAALAVVLSYGPVLAQQRIGDFNAWSVYKVEENGKPVCYIASSPSKSEGNYTRRGKAFALVTLRPVEQRGDEVSFIAGYTFEKDSAVRVEIEDKTWKFFTQDTGAWLPNKPDLDRDMVQAMIRGRDMKVTGISSRGNETLDTYSLSGFTAAYKAMREACGKSG